VDPAKDRVEALSFAAYRILSARYAHAFGAEASLASFDAKMLALGYETDIDVHRGRQSRSRRESDRRGGPRLRSQ
jgi:hypothetical protein